MDKAMVTTALLRQKMARYGITQTALAEESGIHQSAISAALSNHQYIGPMRLNRLHDAILRLSVDPAHVTLPSAPDEPPVQEPRIRRL